MRLLNPLFSTEVLLWLLYSVYRYAYLPGVKLGAVFEDVRKSILASYSRSTARDQSMYRECMERILSKVCFIYDVVVDM